MSANTKKIIFAVIVTVLVLYGIISWFKNDEFSPEEINSILQNKEKDIVKIQKVELTSQALKPPYLEQNSYKVKNWDVIGNAMVKNHEYIRLTSDNPHQVGNMFTSKPINAQSFEMELTFHIHSKSTTLVADGFAIWFLDSKSDIGDVFGAQNDFKGLGIMIDTYRNGKRGQFPFVNLMLGDGNTHYDKATDGYNTRLAGCSAQLVLNPASGVTKARIVYIKDGYFSLDFNYDNKHENWVNCVTLNNVKLPIIKHLGLSAETGDVTETVDVIENKIFGLYKPDGSFIESFQELEALISEQDASKSQSELSSSNSKNKKNSAKTRKSLSRLRRAEKKIKEQQKQRNLEKYGHEDANIVTHFFGKVLNFIKYVIYCFIVVMLLWFALITIRVFMQKKKPKTTGLLD